jgi:ADP-dependent phosphofructokinase/glucokinase
LEGLEFLCQRYELNGIVLHTKDYAMYYGAAMGDVDVVKGLTMGNLMAGTRARIGKYGSYAECAALLQLPFSPIGLDFAEKLELMEPPRLTRLVPSRYMPHPKCTIGLGDTFVAGFMTSFIN